MTAPKNTECKPELIARLREQTSEIAVVGINGWGNTMTDAADELERQSARIAELEAVRPGLVNAGFELAAKHVDVPYIRSGNEFAAAIRSLAAQYVIEGMK